MVLSPFVCYLCGQNGESRYHIFIHCTFTKSVEILSLGIIPGLCYAGISIGPCSSVGKRYKGGKRQDLFEDLASGCCLGNLERKKLYSCG